MTQNRSLDPKILKLALDARDRFLRVPLPKCLLCKVNPHIISKNGLAPCLSCQKSLKMNIGSLYSPRTIKLALEAKEKFLKSQKVNNRFFEYMELESAKYKLLADLKLPTSLPTFSSLS